MTDFYFRTDRFSEVTAFLFRSFPSCLRSRPIGTFPHINIDTTERVKGTQCRGFDSVFKTTIPRRGRGEAEVRSRSDSTEDELHEVREFMAELTLSQFRGDVRPCSKPIME